MLIERIAERIAGRGVGAASNGDGPLAGADPLANATCRLRPRVPDPSDSP